MLIWGGTAARQAAAEGITSPHSSTIRWAFNDAGGDDEPSAPDPATAVVSGTITNRGNVHGLAT
jgi:hypothetical protein